MEKNIPFIADKNIKTIEISLKRSRNPVTMEEVVSRRNLNRIQFNPDYFSKHTEQGQMLMIFHEFTHGALHLEGGDSSHNTMINDPAYLQGIKDIWPGQTDEFYDAMKYSGTTVDCQEYKDKTKEERDAINYIMNDNMLKK